MRELTNYYTVFIVDDEPMVRKMIAFRLRSHTNLKIYNFPSGEECLAHISLKPDILILDYHLVPYNRFGLNGLDVLHEIKQNLPNIQVAMLSSQDNIDVALHSMKRGAEDYIIKKSSFPFDIERIINRFIENIELKKMLHGLRKRA